MRRSVEGPPAEGWLATTCARCGTTLVCGADATTCWCDRVVLSGSQRAYLRSLDLRGCLCPTCLEAPPGDAEEGVPEAPPPQG